MPALRNLFEGKPLRSPIHPAVVHLPIALFPLSVLLDVASRVCPCNELYFVRGAFIALVAGLATGLFAAVFGLVDYSDIRADHPAKKTATTHMLLNVVALALFAASAWLRRDALDHMATAYGPLWLSVLALGVLGYSGYLGGHLVYSEGIAVGRHRRQTRTPTRTIEAGASTRGAVAVADATALEDGESLRVDLKGTIIAIVRQGDRYYAFQEFCTHRYGPLSEGRSADCEVTCPWHGSRFDVRTGKVIAGPAKVDLRTFPTTIRDGKIWVEPPAR